MADSSAADESSTASVEHFLNYMTSCALGETSEDQSALEQGAVQTSLAVGSGGGTSSGAAGAAPPGGRSPRALPVPSCGALPPPIGQGCGACGGACGGGVVGDAARAAGALAGLQALATAWSLPRPGASHERSPERPKRGLRAMHTPRS